MSSNVWKALQNKVKHTVGNITSSHKYVVDVPNGALFTEDVDNFVLAELGFNAEGERTAKNLTDAKKEGVLVAAPERRYLGESISEFFVGAGERGRVVYLTKGFRFHSSAFALATGTTALEAGLVAHFDVTSKQFLIHDGTHADYETAKNKFTLTTNDETMHFGLGTPCVQFEVI